MSLSAQRAMFAITAVIMLACAIFAPAWGQTDREEGESRGVRIIAAPTPPAESSSATQKSPNGNIENHSPLTPATPAPDLTSPSAPTTVTPSQPVAPLSGPVAKLPTETDSGVGQNQQDLEALAREIKIPNAAGLSMKIHPGLEVAAGSRVSFSVSTKKEGYLILLDIDATGKLTQIYPNPMSLIAPGRIRERSNSIRPGQVLQIPDQTSPYTGFEFVAAPPIGTAMVVALLSDRAVQLVDLPDLPPPRLGGASTVDYLIKVANELRIPNAAGNGLLNDAHWSFDVKFYAIKQRVTSPE